MGELNNRLSGFSAEEDAEDAAAYAKYLERRAAGTLGPGLTPAEVRDRLGLERSSTRSSTCMASPADE
jgi:hypothetical protein